jgi:predicted metalloprotease
MEFNDDNVSSNIEDRRGFGPVGMGVGGLGLGGIAILIIGALLGIDPSTLLNVAQQASPPSQQYTREERANAGPPQDPAGHFAGQVLRSTEQVWGAIFQQSGARYRNPTLVLYDGATPSACGLGRSAMGPFYCPNDEKVYLDTSFFRDLQTRFHVPGNFPEAYVVAHEIGHHVQKLAGTFDRMQESGRAGAHGASSTSVRMELQADCYAGVWAHHAGQDTARISDQDIEQGLNAASAIGDDRLQRQSQGYVAPDSFTHGSSAQRVRWFKRGIQSGNPADCDTFGAQSL